MSPAYRKASQHAAMWLLVCFTGIAGELLVLYACHVTGIEKRIQAWVFVPAAIPFILAIVFGWRCMAQHHRKRLNGLLSTLEPLGFLMSIEPKPETKASFWQSMDRVMGTLGMNRGAEAVQWIAFRGEAGSRMAAWEYHYTTGSGKTTQTHDFSAVAWPAGHPALPPGLAELPGCQIQRLDWLQRHARRKEEIPLPGLELFQKTWAVFGSAGTAAKVLTPAWTALLARSPKGEGWHIGDGWVCCSFRGTLDAQNFWRFLGHAEELRAQLK